MMVLFLIISMLGMANRPGSPNYKADLLLHNGVIYTVNDSFEVADAMVIGGGKIIAVGSESVLRKEFSATEEINLQGKPVYPGFIDSHCHFYGYGLTLRQADLTGTKSADEVIAVLKKHQMQFPSALIQGRGWDQNDWDRKEFPDKHILDRAFPETPVYLTRVDGHAAWLNSKVLTMLGIQSDTIVTGGEIIADAQGVTGILVDNAMSLVEKILPPVGHQEQIQALQAAERDCFAVGLTMVGDAGLDKDVVLLIDSLQKANKLHMNIYVMLNPTQENIDHFINKGIYQTDRMNVRSVKLFADGALGSGGALLIESYSDNPVNRGVQLSSTEFLTQTCRLAYEKGYQINTHCIGDSAVRLMLTIYSRFLPENNDLRWRIEHCQVVHPDDFVLFGQHRIIPSVQTTHATSDMYWAGDRLGEKRLRNAYAYKTLLDQNGWLANGSDFPVESINPLLGFYAATTRKDLKGFPPDGFQKSDALSREEALRAMTIWAARAAFRESETGSLEPGKAADFVILDHDIMKADDLEIPETKVLQTYIGGVIVFNRQVDN